MNPLVTRQGKPLEPGLYNFDEKTRVFSIDQLNTFLMDDIIIDFSFIDNITFEMNRSENVTLVCGNNCYIITGIGCRIDCGNNCTIKSSHSTHVTSGHDCIIVSGHSSNITTANRCTITVGDSSYVSSHESIITCSHSCNIDSRYSYIKSEQNCIISTVNLFSGSTVMGSEILVDCGEDSIIKTNNISKLKYKSKLLIKTGEFIVNTDINYYKDLEGFILSVEEIKMLDLFPLKEPRKLLLHVKCDLGKRLFNWYKNKKLL